MIFVDNKVYSKYTLIGDKMTFSIITLGCKVNRYESQYMSELLKESGYEETSAYTADIVIINSCTVTAVADAKNRKAIHRVRRENENACIILTGCMSQAFSKDFDGFSECDIVIGNKSRKNIVGIIEQYFINKEKMCVVEEYTNKDEFEDISVNSFTDRTRAFVKIEDGCNQFCTYCIIPYSRGRVRSKSIETLKTEVENLASNGFCEIVLVGINLSAYGQDIGLNLYDAVKCVCDVEKIKRVRLGSFEPERMTKEIITMLSKEEKFCPNFHLSLQSGCTHTLKSMRRHYTADEYSAIVNDIRECFENSSITTDIMVGFSGESDSDFEESLLFAEKTGFAKIHVFPYSRRKGTKAYDFPDIVPDNIKTQRTKRMLDVASISRKAFLITQVGKTEEVLFENKMKDESFAGYTRNYTPIRVKSEIDLSNQIKNVLITKVCDDYCIGEIVE